MIFLVSVINVNLYIFHKHAVKLCYILCMYPIYKAANENLAQSIASEQFKLVNIRSVCVLR